LIIGQLLPYSSGMAKEPERQYRDQPVKTNTDKSDKSVGQPRPKPEKVKKKH
jgi:hypothetical protein